MINTVDIHPMYHFAPRKYILIPFSKKQQSSSCSRKLAWSVFQEIANRGLSVQSESVMKTKTRNLYQMWNVKVNPSQPMEKTNFRHFYK